MTPPLQTVTWRQSVATVVAVGLALAGLVFVLRSDGLPAVNAASSRATRWVVHEPTGRVVLVDGFGGRALASLDLNAPGGDLSVAEGPGGTYVLDDSTAEVRTVDGADLRLGAPLALAALGDGVALARSGPSGLIVANPATGVATLVTNDEPVDISFDADNGPGVDTTTTVALAPDGSIWSLVDGSLERASSSAATSENLGLDDAVLSLVNNEPLVLDRELNRVRFGSGTWQRIPSDIDGSELVIQRPGPAAECGWVGGGDELWCVSSDGIGEAVTIPGLVIGGGDLLAIAGDAAALVRRGPTEVVQFDWRTEEVLDQQPLTVAARTQLEVTSTNDVIWIDDVSGDFVWSVHPWGIEAIDKNASGLFVVDDEGSIIEEGDGDASEAAGADDGVAIEPEARDPDNNGIDDPPIAVDDPVTARAGASVPVAVTANDYDPDGEAIAVSDVGTPGHGTVEVGTASTVIYAPDSGYVGVDEFEYTIVDGDGTEATASVIVELLPADGTNRAPVGAPDESETGSGVAVIVDVLLNDVDPERDGLRLDSFSAEPDIGNVNETEGLSGLPALEYTPVAGFEGTARFSYRPVDTFGAVGEPVEVTVDVARAGDENRPPVVAPDSVRTRRYSKAIVPVLVNDSDPDGDPLVLSVVLPLPAGIDVEVQGDQLVVTPLAGSGESVIFEYEVDDGRGNQVSGPVLVSVIEEREPNRPPVVSPDIETVVFGQTILIDVTANDSDPDGDPLAVTAISQPDSGGTTASGGRNQIEFTPSMIDAEEESNVRFTYTVSDGNGHEVVGDVTVTVLAEALPEPPYARDDSTFTFVNDPVTIDVLRNDGDPSGERPTIVGTPGCPTGGTATITADSQVRFDPPPGSSGAFRCSYEVTNSQNLRDSAAIIISVREPETGNSEPIARLDTATIHVGESVSRDVTANDIDPDGDSSLLRVTSLNQPPFGSATRNGNVIAFSADSTRGVATITYQVEDSEGALATGRFQITVTEAENVAPIAVPDARQIVGPGVQQTFDVLANDRDPDDSPGGLTLTSAQLIEGDGSLSQSGSQVTITAQPEFEGVLIGTYSIRDGEGLTASSTVTLTVTPPANRSPIAVDDNVSVANGGSVTIPVLQNDSDPDGDPLTVSIVSGPDASLGSASVTSDQNITFQARQGQDGLASITYQVSDGELADTATALVTVVSCQASPPVATDAFLTTGYQIPITVNLANYSSNGEVVNVIGPSGYANGVYTPPVGENGNVTIGFGVRNQCDQEANGTITIDVNQSPSSQDKSITLSRGAIVEVPVGQLGSDDESLTITGSEGAPSWVTTIGGRLEISVPADAAFGTTSWTTTISDPGGLTASATVSVTVTSGAPVAVADAIDASVGAGTTDLLANDSDPDGPNSELTIQSIPTAVSFDGGGTGTITRSGGQVTVTTTDGTGTGSFTYTIIDVDGAVSNAATVTVAGPPVATTTTTTTTTEPEGNTAPVAADQSVSVVAGTPTTIDLEVFDADGDGLTVIDVVDPAGVASVSGLTMTILAPSAETFTVTYRVTDGTDPSDTATVTVDASTVPTTTTVPPTTVPTTTVPTTTTTVPTTTTTVPTTTVPTTTVPPDPPPDGG